MKRNPQTPFVPQNPALHKAIKSLYNNIIRTFEQEGRDFSSQAFLELFASEWAYLATMDYSEEAKAAAQPILDAAFAPIFVGKTKYALSLFFSNSSGGSDEYYFCEMVHHFLDFVIPRTAGLPNASELFDKYYEPLETSIYSDRFQVTFYAVIENASDHGGAARDSSGVKLSYYSPLPGGANTEYLRNRVVSYFEILRAAHLDRNELEGGAKYGFFVMEFTEERRKHPGLHPRYLRIC